MTDSELLHHLTSLEESLLQQATRQNPTLVASLLTDDFREFGASGRTYSKPEILAALSAAPPKTITASDFHLRILTPEAALLTYRTLKPGPIAALRSSLWILTEGTWKMCFHQGTPTA